MVSACLTSWTFHFDAIDFGDVDVASPVVLADIGFGGIEGHGTLEKVFTTEKGIKKVSKRVLLCVLQIRQIEVRFVLRS